MERNLKLELWLAGGIVLLMVLIGAGVYFLYLPKIQGTSKTVTTATPTVAKAACEALKVDSGEGTSKPVISSVLNKNKEKRSDICAWTVNGVVSHTSFPVGGKCVFGGKNLGTNGAYKIGLAVEENKCELSTEVTVN